MVVSFFGREMVVSFFGREMVFSFFGREMVVTLVEKWFCYFHLLEKVQFSSHFTVRVWGQKEFCSNSKKSGKTKVNWDFRDTKNEARGEFVHFSEENRSGT